MEADVDEVSILQSCAQQNGREMAAQVIPTHDVVLSGAASAAKVHRENTNTSKGSRREFQTALWANLMKTSKIHPEMYQHAYQSPLSLHTPVRGLE